MTINDFYKQVTDAFMADDDVKEIYRLRESDTFDKRFGKVSVEGVMMYMWAFGLWLISQMFAKHRSEVLADLERLKPHTLNWYVTKTKAYQHGDELPRDKATKMYISDTYKTINEGKQIVRYAVAQEREGKIYLKVAKYKSSKERVPARLTDNELNGLKRYLSQVKDAGVPITIISNSPDEMEVEMVIYYNPMLLSPTTNDLVATIDGENKSVVSDAIKKVVENLPFNGDCRNSDILDAVKAIDGVDVADIVTVKTKPANGALKPVVGYVTPESGYFKLTKLTLTLKPYSYGNEI